MIPLMMHVVRVDAACRRNAAAVLAVIFAILLVYRCGFSEAAAQRNDTLPVRHGDPCIVYTYDANGNRQSQTITVSGGGMTPTWGTGTWGCFKWTP